MIESTVEELILEVSGASQLVKSELVQRLWSGYGHIIRCWLADAKYNSVIIKNVKPPNAMNHPRGWNTNISHQRKLKSYQVENNWYGGLGNRTHKNCKIPKLYHSSQTKNEMLLIMEDLNSSGFDVRKNHASIEEMKSCLRWLANFHACFLNINDEDLWKIGTYWHLDTRPDEFKIMSNVNLKRAAKALDNHLNLVKYKSIVHGDAKLANFCFNDKDGTVAAVDFQYVGGGCGMKDVAYFISSCLDERDCQLHETQLLDYYFEEFHGALIKNGHGSISKQVVEEWRPMYRYAWADFYRFLDGWSPGHWKMHKYSTDIVNEVLEELELGHS